MTSLIRLHLLAPTGTHAHCLSLDEAGRIIGRETWSVDPPQRCRPPRSDAPVRDVLAVPGAAVGSTWMAIDAASEAQAVALARHRMEGRHASAPGALHVVLAPAHEGEPERQVLVVDPDLMQHWLDAASRLGIEADVVLPDYMLLPGPVPAGADDSAATAPATTRLERAGQWLVRGDRLAFTAEPELARLLLDMPADGATGTVVLPPDAGDESLAAGALQPSVNLLQHRFAPRRGDAGVASWHRVAILAALLVLSPALLAAGDAVRHGIAAMRLEREADDTARALLGASAADLPPAVALQDALDSGASGTTTPAALAPLFAAVGQVPGLHIERLDATEGRPVSACVAPATPADLDALREALARKGLSMAPGPASPTPADCAGHVLILAPEVHQ
ncbi:type II secretion system protein GspL [Marilutibacter spongiae]|uniref:GspL cytoplasmic actin-ATPase-like domain-containing protein n=1 Tax=Marilutibacter spongiae TaxID=2025720 RepID=A0A7W3TM98_9GAMM|nr:type II secretion system protein GspL [Lysobacter spongiae]MBB1060923.1 hypothetical protein [Lysobacter spongiae]